MNKCIKLLSAIMAIILAICSVPFSAFADDEVVDDTTNTEQVEITLDERAQQILDTMTIEEKLAQLLMVYVPSKDATKAVKKYQFGGYVLFANNFKNKTKSEKKKQITAYQKASKINMLISVDEEGGIVNRVSLYKQYRKSPFKSPRNVYKAGGWDGVVSDTKEKAKLLKSMGINTNLAPVADVAYNSKNYIYSRSFSTSASSTSKYIKKVVTQMGKDNLVSTLKHFPGYGNNGDTHSNIIKDKRSLKTFETRDLKPFQAGIDAGCDMVMVSHNIVTAFDKKNPASLSKKVHKYLRNDMGFDGVIISDGLGMAGVLDFVGGDSGEVTVRAILAGNDMVCTGAYAKPMKALKEAVKSGRLSEEQVNQSVLRILKLKLNRGIIE